jgi:hypothetical protein
LDCDHLFADYFEPEATDVVKLANDVPEGSLIENSGEKLEDVFEIDLTNAKLLMEVKTGPFDMEEFVTKVVEPEVNPTLLLLEWKPAFVVGGFAAVPWPKDEGEGFDRTYAADPARKSFIFSLEPKAQRFDLLEPDQALLRRTGGEGQWRSFRFGDDLRLFDDGECEGSCCAYADGPDDRGFPCDRCDVSFTRFELWAL